MNELENVLDRGLPHYYWQRRHTLSIVLMVGFGLLLIYLVYALFFA